MELWSSDVITVDTTVVDESQRIIEGIATAPVYDRVNELITADAIKKALPDYMKLPVVTVLHKDYAVGKTIAAKILDDGSLFVKIKLKPTKDVDKVWDLIKAGVLNSFSISGSRTSSTCSRANMGSPCVTDGIHLSTITICGNDAANPKANISYINKTLFGEDMTEIKVDSSVPAVVNDVITSSTSTGLDLTKTVPVVDLSEVLEAVGKLEKTVSGLAESMQKPSVETVVAEPVDDTLQKSISDLANTVSELSKQFAGFEQRISTLEEQKVEKGGIVLDEQGEPKAVGNIRIEDYILNRYSH